MTGYGIRMRVITKAHAAANATLCIVCGTVSKKEAANAKKKEYANASIDL